MKGMLEKTQVSPEMIVGKIIHCNSVIEALDEMHMSNECFGEVPLSAFSLLKD